MVQHFHWFYISVKEWVLWGYEPKAVMATKVSLGKNAILDECSFKWLGWIGSEGYLRGLVRCIARARALQWVREGVKNPSHRKSPYFLTSSFLNFLLPTKDISPISIFPYFPPDLRISQIFSCIYNFITLQELWNCPI